MSIHVDCNSPTNLVWMCPIVISPLMERHRPNMIISLRKHLYPSICKHVYWKLVFLTLLNVAKLCFLDWQTVLKGIWPQIFVILRLGTKVFSQWDTALQMYTSLASVHSYKGLMVMLPDRFYNANNISLYEISIDQKICCAFLS